MKVYHNTTNITGEALQEVTENAHNIKDIIYDLFKQFPEDKTPFEVSVLLLKNGFKYPIWSIRTRITALTRGGVLIKSPSASTKGEYNQPNHTWKLGNHPDNTIEPEFIFKNR